VLLLELLWEVLDDAEFTELDPEDDVSELDEVRNTEDEEEVELGVDKEDVDVEAVEDDEEVDVEDFNDKPAYAPTRIITITTITIPIFAIFEIARFNPIIESRSPSQP
jgi:hypothetical protein